MGTRLYGFDNTKRVTVGTSDRAALELATYKAYVESQGGVIVDENALYTVYQGLISSGEIDKQCYMIGYQFGMLKDESNFISKMFSIVPISGDYLEFTPVLSDNRPLLDPGHIEMYTGSYARNLLSEAIPLLKKSFYIEEVTYKQYISSVSYAVGSDPLNAGIRNGTQSTGRLLLFTYNEAGTSVSTTSNNNYLDNDFNTYKTLYTRTGDNCVPELYKGGILFQTFASRAWDKSLNSAIKLTGSSTAVHRFKTFKICEV